MNVGEVRLTWRYKLGLRILVGGCGLMVCALPVAAFLQRSMASESTAESAAAVAERLLPPPLRGRARGRLLLPLVPWEEGWPASESGAVVGSGPQGSSFTVVVNPGDSITKILREHSFPDHEITGIIKALASFVDPDILKVGQTFTFHFRSQAGERHFTSLSFRPSSGRVFEIAFASGRWQASLRPSDDQIEQPVALSAVVRSSLYQAAVERGIPHKIIHEFVRAFSQEVDFHRDLHYGTRMHVLFTCTTSSDGVVLDYGSVLFARLDFEDRQLYSYRYSSPAGVGYFDASGRSLRLEYLGRPLENWDVSSPYGMRVHPRSGRWRMHHGIDLRARTGTPVMATGNGEIIFMSLGRGYGNYIKIRHDQSLETRYAHLSGFAQGLGVGDRVARGQVIGYVGSSGLSTGPHLHYEVRRDGRSLDPAREAPRLDYVLVGNALSDFRRHTWRVDRIFQEAPSATCDV